MAEEKDKPVLDEQMLGKLLEAAYVLQEHNRAMRKLGLNLERQRDRLNEQTPPNPTLPPPISRNAADAHVAQDDYTFTLAQIVESQRLIQVRRLELQEAMSLVAERVASIARGSGAGIGILDRKKVLYRAGVGDLALPAGTEVAMEKALCIACIRTGQVIRCSDVNPEFLLDAEECHRRGIAAIIAVPVYHDGGIAGGLEVYYATTQAFTEQDVHTCQLMAGLVTEALARDEELNSKKSLAAERAVMLETAEKLKSNPPPARKLTTKKASPRKARAASVSSALTFVCRQCGHDLVGEEQFCGKCGSPRNAELEPVNSHGKVSSPRRIEEATPDPTFSNRSAMAAGAHASASGVLNDKAFPSALLPDADEFFAPVVATEEAVANTTEAPELSATHETAHEIKVEALENPDFGARLETDDDGAEVSEAETALVKTSHAVAWTSAANAREFLEQLAASDQRSSLIRFWKARRADVYLAIAVIVVAVVIRWGIWSNHPIAATGSPATTSAGRHTPETDTGLSFFDKVLISLGLADPPATPEYKGNPETQVWVDLHTALYYCPGTDLYGKTAKGKYASQRDAQLDQFEPAYRKPCD